MNRLRRSPRRRRRCAPPARRVVRPRPPWTLEGAPVDVSPGETLFIPRGAVHHFDNAHDTDAKALAIVTPGILGPDFFREVASILDASAGGPPDVVALGEVMRRHGLTPAPPAQIPSKP